MNWIDSPRDFRLRRERLFKYTNPRVREFDLVKDSWVMWGAYDLGSFKNLPKGLKRPEFFKLVEEFAKQKSSLLMIEEDHRYFKDRRGPVALISIDNYGWRIEPQIDFFFWATKRNRLAALVCFLHMVRYSKDVGVCVVRSGKSDNKLCTHLYKYGLLRPVGEIPNANPNGSDYLYFLKCKKTVEQQEELKAA